MEKVYWVFTGFWKTQRGNFFRCSFAINIHVRFSKGTSNDTHSLESRRKGELANNANLKRCLLEIEKQKLSLKN